MKELPNTLHELMRLALQDLRKCLVDPAYVVGMTEWHRVIDCGDDFDDDRACVVCMAGAVMSQSLGASPLDHLEPGCYRTGGDSYADKLLAINQVRMGAIRAAMDCLHPVLTQDQRDNAELAERLHLEVDTAYNARHPDRLMQNFPESRAAQRRRYGAFPTDEIVADWFNTWEKYVDKLEELGL